VSLDDSVKTIRKTDYRLPPEDLEAAFGCVLHRNRARLASVFGKQVLAIDDEFYQEAAN